MKILIMYIFLKKLIFFPNDARVTGVMMSDVAILVTNVYLS